MKERNHAFFWYLTDFVMAKRMEDDGLSCIVCLSLNCEHELLKQSCATGPAGLQLLVISGSSRSVSSSSSGFHLSH